MTIVVASLGTMGDTAGRSAYSCQVSEAPSAASLVLVAVVVNDTGGANPPTSVVGLNQIFSLVTSGVSFNDIAPPSAHNLSVWRSMGGTPDTSLITATFAASGNGCAMLVHAISGVSQSGTSGADAVGLSSISSVNGSAALMLTGGSAASTANAWIAFCSSQSSEGPTASGNFQSGLSAGFLTADTNLVSAWTLLATGSLLTFTASGVDDRGGIMVQLVGDNPAIVVPSPSTFTYSQQVRQHLRIPQPPIGLQDPVMYQYLTTVARILNAEAYISKFSAANPNTSGLTGIPGNLAVNVGSGSTWTRLWMMGGGPASTSTNSWQMFRMA